MNNINIPTVNCKWCDHVTPFVGTKCCDGCWELARRIYVSNVSVLAKIIRGRLTSADLAVLKQLLNKER